jgi:hypothetical protein
MGMIDGAGLNQAFLSTVIGNPPSFLPYEPFNHPFRLRVLNLPYEANDLPFTTVFPVPGFYFINRKSAACGL